MRTPIAASGVALLLVLVACGGDGEPAATESESTTATVSTTGSATTATTDAQTTTVVPAATAASTTTAASADGEPVGDGCAHVIGGSVEPLADGTYRVEATVRSADTGWDKYADAWEVRTTDGTVLGVRELLHPHETEQPFTRSLSAVEIPEGVDEVVLAARDSVEGFCGETYRVPLEG